MASFVPAHSETVEDQRRYTEARLVEVACLDCLAVVRVKKNSDHHTSIQWSGEARAACPVLARVDREGPQGRTIHAGCERLGASIEAAVKDGALDVGAEDGY